MSKKQRRLLFSMPSFKRQAPAGKADARADFQKALEAWTAAAAPWIKANATPKENAAFVALRTKLHAGEKLTPDEQMTIGILIARQPAELKKLFFVMSERFKALG